MAKWGGRRAQAATAYCQRVYGWTCWLCGHDIAPDDYSVDHVVPRSVDASLTWIPTNWRPAHFRSHPEIGCIGNVGRGNRMRRKSQRELWRAAGW